MVQVLPYVPSFLEQLTPHIKQATSDVAGSLEQRSALKGLQEYAKRFQSQQNADGTPGASQEIPEISPMEAANLATLAAKAYGKDTASAKAFTDQIYRNQKSQEKRALQERQFQSKRAEKAEPELLERETKLQHYEQEAARFERLQELFSPELEGKFPSSLSVGLLTKDGELRPTAAALLSPEAQEAVKLVADNLSGAKDTFGARVTNFDLQAYMKRLPTLLNSSEGRRRVLRDLRLMNKLNTMHQEGVLEIVEREGGPEKISLSQAERRYRKEHSKEIEQLKKEFVNPEKHVFQDRPDPKVYEGRVIIDEQTGERLKSNGKEWVPE